MNRVWHATSAASSAKRSSAMGSRSMQISMPAGPMRSATRRAWPPAPRVQSIATSPGSGSTRSISSPARTGVCVWVMSSSVAKARCDVGHVVENLRLVGGVRAAIEDLEAFAGAGDHDVAVEAGVLGEVLGDHHAVGGVDVGVMGEVEEEALERPRLG